MKYIKKYELKEYKYPYEKIDIGDYVTFKPDTNSVNTFLDRVLKDLVAKVIDKRDMFGGEVDIELPSGKILFGISLYRIDKWSKDKNELEAYLNAKKYNL